MRKICVVVLVLALMLSGCGKEAAADRLMTSELEGTWPAVGGGTVTISNVTADGFDIEIRSGCKTETFRIYRDAVWEYDDFIQVSFQTSSYFTFSAGSYDDLIGTGQVDINFYETVQEREIYIDRSSKETYTFNVEISFAVINKSAYGYDGYGGALLLLIEQ